jgi:lipoprotein signal peptidase
VRSAAVCASAFACALTLDLLTKFYAVARLHGPHGIVFNDRPHDLAMRLDVSLLTIAAVFLLERAARRRGFGRLLLPWIGVGILTGGTIGNGVSTYLWSAGVPDFIRVEGGWMWNVADFEIVAGLLGTALSLVVSAVYAYARYRLAPRPAEL